MVTKATTGDLKVKVTLMTDNQSTTGNPKVKITLMTDNQNNHG